MKLITYLSCSAWAVHASIMTSEQPSRSYIWSYVVPLRSETSGAYVYASFSQPWYKRVRYACIYLVLSATDQAKAVWQLIQQVRETTSEVSEHARLPRPLLQSPYSVYKWRICLEKLTLYHFTRSRRVVQSLRKKTKGNPREYSRTKDMNLTLDAFELNRFTNYYSNQSNTSIFHLQDF